MQYESLTDRGETEKERKENRNANGNHSLDFFPFSYSSNHQIK